MLCYPIHVTTLTIHTGFRTASPLTPTEFDSYAVSFACTLFYWLPLHAHEKMLRALNKTSERFEEAELQLFLPLVT
jgi:hypothetical protein